MSWLVYSAAPINVPSHPAPRSSLARASAMPVGERRTNPDLQVGDVVTLRSGGPPMTVVSLDEDAPDVLCLWFDSVLRHQRASIPVACLEIARPR